MILTTLQPGTTATVAALATDEDTVIKKLSAMGIYPGVAIVLEQRFPSYIVKVGRTRAAFDQHIARCIYLYPAHYNDTAID